MKTEIIKDIRQGFETAYINGTLASNLEYKPSFVSNNPKEGKKVISTIEEELLRCEHFQISVAFITMGGITPLLQTLKELERKGVVGEILTTNYLNFSEPRALEKLNELSNITLKMYDVEVADSGFHTKGYIFKKEEVYRIILGSSNMTSAALTSNIEWNTKIISSEQGEVASEIIKEFNNLWNSDYALDFETFYEIYKVRYELIKHQREEAKKDIVPSFEKYTLKPNSMQEEFIINLRKIIEKGEERALLISATGTGKTYASAFAVRELGFKRVLFIVHRAQLAKQAKKSFERVFNNFVSMGIVGDGKHEYDSDFIFAMVETLNRDEHLFKYKKDTFDCIILDEAHHSPANTYQKVMEYFKPKLFLGMTATPDKRDDYIEGRNVYELFNHQIAHEIRLQKAMEDDLLCPFHYFGISDIAMLNDKTFKGKIITEKDFNLLTSEERVDHVIEQAQYYGYSGDRVKGLIFCSRNKECESLSKLFNERGYRTLALSNETPQKLRETAFERLAMKEEDAIDEFQDLSSTMYGMSQLGDDVFIFVTYHKEENTDEEKQYVDGKPDYADEFVDNVIFRWDSQIDKKLDGAYMNKVLNTPRKHLFVQKTDAENNFFYMGEFDVLDAYEEEKKNNRGLMKPICKLKFRMHTAVREDLLRYLQSGNEMEKEAI